jgi:dipeptidyl aminopeptidase/acylaminoacyl peptidase
MVSITGCRDSFVGPENLSPSSDGTRVYYSSVDVVRNGVTVSYSIGPVMSVSVDGNDTPHPLNTVPSVIASPPQRGKVVYYQPTDWGLALGRAVVARADGAEPQVIAEGSRGSRIIMAPVVLAPNGSLVAYVIRDIPTTTNFLCLADLHGNVRKMVPIDCGCDIYQLEFSPDCSLVAYVGTAEENPHITIVDVASGSRYTIGENVGASFAWSPDGRYIAYTRGNNFYYLGYPIQDVGSVVQGSSINIVDVEGFHDTQILQSEDEIFDLAWSPDGTSLVYARRNGDSPRLHSDLWITNTSGGATRRLTSTDDVANLRPEWSPDGLRIVYTSIPANDDGATDRYPEVRRFDLYTSTVTVIARRAFGGILE